MTVWGEAPAHKRSAVAFWFSVHWIPSLALVSRFYVGIGANTPLSLLIGFLISFLFPRENRVSFLISFLVGSLFPRESRGQFPDWFPDCTQVPGYQVTKRCFVGREKTMGGGRAPLREYLTRL
jgi:hypothetical protein